MPTPSAAADGVDIARDLGDARKGRGNAREEIDDAQTRCAVMVLRARALGTEGFSETASGSRASRRASQARARFLVARCDAFGAAFDGTPKRTGTMAAAALDEYDLAIYPGFYRRPMARWNEDGSCAPMARARGPKGEAFQPLLKQSDIDDDIGHIEHEVRGSRVEKSRA